MTLFNDIFDVVAKDPTQHNCGNPLWRILNTTAKTVVADTFYDGASKSNFGPFGDIVFPYHEMGAIDSLDLFGIDELILFSFYKNNVGGYKKVVDFGANIGLHSLLLSKCGYDVRSFEPDEWHSDILLKNMSLNGVSTDLHKAAISLEGGEAEFVRVLGNTTGSHLKGAKDNAYGDLDVFKVKIEAAQPHLEWADLAKIDIEGHEADLLSGLPLSTWENTDAIVEVGTEANAKVVFDRFSGSAVNLFAQKISWGMVSSVSDIPTSHREGSLFISAKDKMPWG